MNCKNTQLPPCPRSLIFENALTLGGFTHNRDIHKVHEMRGVDLVFSQKIEWHAQHRMNVVKGEKTHMEI
jgi:hypothetical protein